MNKAQKSQIQERIDLLTHIKTDKKLYKFIDQVVALIKAGNLMIMAGNGGSSADADHFVSELMGRYQKDRKPFPAVSLSHPSTITCIGNDYGYTDVFSRQVEAFARKKTVLVVFSTSGSSENINRAAEEAISRGIQVVFFGGKDGGCMETFQRYDIGYIVPCEETALIQEAHQMLIHMICEELEK